MHFSEGGYDRIAIKLFNQINVDCYYLEYDTERAGTFEPLKFLPKNKSLVLGLISSKLKQVCGAYMLKQFVRSRLTISVTSSRILRSSKRVYSRRQKSSPTARRRGLSRRR